MRAGLHVVARLVDLERQRHREDHADASWLATTLRVQNERPSRERVTSKRIGSSASPRPDEVGVQRVHVEAIVHRRGAGPQALGDDLAAVEPAPRVLRSPAEEDVVPQRLELHHRHEVHAGS